MCKNDSIRILPQFASVKFFYIIKSMKLTKLGCYLLVFRANLRAFSHIFATNNIYNDHICVRKSHLDPRKKLIFLATKLAVFCLLYCKFKTNSCPVFPHTTRWRLKIITFKDFKSTDKWLESIINNQRV